MRYKQVGRHGKTALSGKDFWFNNEVRRERFPNATKLAKRFEIAPKSAQRAIDHFRDRLLAPLQYESAKKSTINHITL